MEDDHWYTKMEDLFLIYNFSSYGAMELASLFSFGVYMVMAMCFVGCECILEFGTEGQTE